MRTTARRFAVMLGVAALVLLAWSPALARQSAPPQAPPTNPFTALEADHIHPMHEIYAAMIRLPLAALLAGALALRPRRRGTPPRDPAVIQTQIVLGVVGAVIMLVVGASLARAFGIV